MSCSNGSCSAESLGCAVGDVVNPTHRFGATGGGVTGPPAVSGSCLLPPGFDNCLSYSGDLAPCDVARLQRTRRRFVTTGTELDGSLVDVTVELSSQLSTPAGYTWWRAFVGPPIGVAHQLCPRDFSAHVKGPVLDADLTGEILEVAIQSERIYQDGDGNFVRAWTFPKPADPDDLRITDGRCACERLCDCVIVQGSVAINILLPTQVPLDLVSVVHKGVRDCWQISCGSCPPAKLCGRELLVP